MTKIKQLAQKPMKFAFLLFFLFALCFLLIVFNLLTGNTKTEATETYSASPAEEEAMFSDMDNQEEVDSEDGPIEAIAEAEEVVSVDQELEEKKVEAYEIAQTFATILFDTNGSDPTDKAKDMNKYSAESLQAVTNDDLQTYRPTKDYYDRKTEEVQAEVTEYDEDMDVLYVEVEVTGAYYNEKGEKTDDAKESYAILFSYEEEVEVVEYILTQQEYGDSGSVANN